MTLTRRTALATMAATFATPFVRPSWAKTGTVNIYSWAEYIGETTLEDFATATGITPVYDTYSSYEDGEAKLLAGSTGYDVVDVAGRSMPMLVKAGVFQPLDRSQLPLWSNLDPDLLKILAAWDPGVAHSAPYMWGSVGFAFNVDLVKARLPGADFEDFATIFKPENAAKLADCGLSLHDSPRDLILIVLKYLGIDPDTTDVSQYQKAADLIKPMRQYVTAFDNENYLNGLPNGEGCAAMVWSGDYAVAKARAAKAGIWRSCAYTEWYDSYPCDEFMVVLEGEVTIESDTFSQTYRAGDAFLIPKGFRGYWRQPVAMLKYYAIVS